MAPSAMQTAALPTNWRLAPEATMAGDEVT